MKESKVKNTHQFDHNHFEKYANRQSLTRFLARYELFKLQIDVKGSIVECGVHYGSGLMAWAKLSASFEPYAIHRKVIGFDTFSGFVEVNNHDKSLVENSESRPGGFQTDFNVFDELNNLIYDFDKNRYLSEFEKVCLVKGDACVSIPNFIEENPHLLVSLLFLDFDLYEPTKVALEYFLPRMPKGAVLAFDEINNQWWPGETMALLHSLNINNYQIKKFHFDPNIAYIVL